MTSLINHNSYIIFAGAFWLIGSAIALRKIDSPWNYFLSAGFAILLIGLFFLVRPKLATQAENLSLQEQIGVGQAVFLEIQSPY